MEGRENVKEEQTKANNREGLLKFKMKKIY